MAAVAPAAGNALPALETRPSGQPDSAGKVNDTGKVDKGATAARDFESVFLTQMVDQMMKTVKLGGMDGGHAEEMWRGFLARAIADQIAATGSTGIAQSVERAISAYKGRSA